MVSNAKACEEAAERIGTTTDNVQAIPRIGRTIFGKLVSLGELNILRALTKATLYFFFARTVRITCSTFSNHDPQNGLPRLYGVRQTLTLEDSASLAWPFALNIEKYSSKTFFSLLQEPRHSSLGLIESMSHRFYCTCKITSITTS